MKTNRKLMCKICYFFGMLYFLLSGFGHFIVAYFYRNGLTSELIYCAYLNLYLFLIAIGHLILMGYFKNDKR